MFQRIVLNERFSRFSCKEMLESLCHIWKSVLCSQLLCLLFSVAFEQLVDESQFILLFHRIERWKGVPFVLQNSHLSSVQVLPVRKAGHPCEALRMLLKAWSQDLKQLWD